MRSIFLLIFLLISQVAGAAGPSVRFDRLTIEDGLSVNAINTIVQDNQGFLWFGTKDGLNRFDGYEFKVYRHNPQDPHSISDNWVYSLYQDNQG